jgi:hypothetical protein
VDVAAIIIYLLITVFITVYVGKVLFTNGRHFIFRMLADDKLTDAVNKVLLTGYYLVNLGYVSIMLTLTLPAKSTAGLIVSLSISIGRILITLGVMHYANIAVLTLWNKFNISKSSNI